jgi:hypothetical protein
MNCMPFKPIAKFSGSIEFNSIAFCTIELALYIR